MDEAAIQAKREKIRKLLEMQRRFIELDHEHGVDMREYFAPEESDPLRGYREQYRDLAMEVVADAHALKGSKPS